MCGVIAISNIYVLSFFTVAIVSEYLIAVESCFQMLDAATQKTFANIELSF